jgi:hypothetical protein
VDALYELQPSLADDITRVFKALERASNGGGQLGKAITVQLKSGNHWGRGARNIRGFKDFLEPTK